MWTQNEIDCYRCKTTHGCRICLNRINNCNMFNLVLAKYKLYGKPPKKEIKK